jgi:hypothetical protein
VDDLNRGIVGSCGGTQALTPNKSKMEKTFGLML